MTISENTVCAGDIVARAQASLDEQAKQWAKASYPADEEVRAALIRANSLPAGKNILGEAGGRDGRPA